MSAITKIITTNNLRATINYVNGKDNERVASVSSWNCLHEDAIESMYETNQFHNKSLKVEGYHIIQSFSDDAFSEYGYASEQAKIDQANLIGHDLAMKLYKDHEFIVVTHRDSKSGYIHNHIVVNGVNWETGKALQGIAKHWRYGVSKANDEVLREYGIKPLNQELRSPNYRPPVVDGIKYNSKDEEARQKGEDTPRIAFLKEIKDVIENNTSLQDVKDELQARNINFDIRLKKSGKAKMKQSFNYDVLEESDVTKTARFKYHEGHAPEGHASLENAQTSGRIGDFFDMRNIMRVIAKNKAEKEHDMDVEFDIYDETNEATRAREIEEDNKERL